MKWPATSDGTEPLVEQELRPFGDENENAGDKKRRPRSLKQKLMASAGLSSPGSSGSPTSPSAISVSSHGGYSMDGFNNGSTSSLGENDVMPLTLTWSNVDYFVEQKAASQTISKQILKGATGSVGPGEMIALMGTSGAGKTTFLNLLSGRNLGSEGRMEGEIRVNGNRRDRSYRRISAYVEQDDILMPLLTVEETFMLHAYLRLPSTWSAEAKKACYRAIINELGLSHTGGTRIGNHQLKGISGGERKRVSIGIELITNPKLLFLDEPTSGLDAFTAFHVMKYVRALADNGRAVIVTIHQPRANIYELFDKLLLLSKGETIYYGPAHEAQRWFEQIGYPCASNNNPADHFLDITTIDTRSAGMEETTKQRNLRMVQEYQESKYFQVAKHEATSKRPSAVLRTKDLLTRLPFYLQFAYLWRRAVEKFFRDRNAVVAEFIQNIVLALLTGCVFFGLEDNQNGIQNRNGTLFFMALMFSFGPSLAAIQLFQAEKPVFLRERSGKLYQVLPYYLAKTFAELPFQLFFPVIFGSVVYWMVGFNPDMARFVFFLLVCIAQYFTVQGVGIVLSALCNADVAAATAPVVVIFFMLFGGFYLNSEDVWIGFVWIEKVSFVMYCWRAFMINEYEGLTFTCDPAGGRCQATGEQVLLAFNMQEVNKWLDLGLLLCIGMAIRMTGYLVLRFIGKPKTKLH